MTAGERRLLLEQAAEHLERAEHATSPSWARARRWQALWLERQAERPDPVRIERAAWWAGIALHVAASVRAVQFYRRNPNG